MALALYGVVMAVDGVALEQAVNAWASAPVAEKAARFASAAAIRWIGGGRGRYLLSVLCGRLIDRNWSKSGALVFRLRNGVTVCSRLLSRLATADTRWAQLASDAST